MQRSRNDSTRRPPWEHRIIKTTQYTTDLSTLQPNKTQGKQLLALLQLGHLLFQHELEAERLECDTLSDEMLAHRLDPVETQRVQHGTSAFHDDQNSDGEEEPDGEEDEDGDDANSTGHGESIGERHRPQHDGELLVSERQSPETEVRGSVRDTVEAEFCRLVLVK